MTELKQLAGRLQAFLETEKTDLWMIHEGVHVDEEQPGEFFKSFKDYPCDLLATRVRSRREDPEWIWWNSMVPGECGEQALAAKDVAAFLPLARYSRRAAEVILEGLELGWEGHPEAVIPTLVSRAGLKIEDLGGSGTFTPPDRIGRWYDPRTWDWRGPVTYVPGRLHFPVKIHGRSLASARVSSESPATMPKILYVSPVGAAARDLLPKALDVFLRAGADCWLLQYDEAELSVPENVKVVRADGYKWQLAFQCLTPAVVAGYDFIFFWDDDIDVSDFDPIRFVHIMAMNRLAMAQPAILSPHPLSHPITGMMPCPTPRRDAGGDKVIRVVGRLTNFVEIMVPVFTRDSWAEFFSYLGPDNGSGWGYDYIPLGRKGIVDALPVIHTRPVQSITTLAALEMKQFLEDQGLFPHPTVEQGWLYESTSPISPDGPVADHHHDSANGNEVSPSKLKGIKFDR